MEDNRPGRKAPGGTARASGTPPPRRRTGGISRWTVGGCALTARSPRRQSLIADELPDGLVVADDAGRVVVFNRAAARLTGIAAEEAIGKYVYDVLPLQGRGQPRLVDVRRPVQRPCHQVQAPRAQPVPWRRHRAAGQRGLRARVLVSVGYAVTPALARCAAW